jgi:hypothetical protein
MGGAWQNCAAKSVPVRFAECRLAATAGALTRSRCSLKRTRIAARAWAGRMVPPGVGGPVRPGLGRVVLVGSGPSRADRAKQNYVGRSTCAGEQKPRRGGGVSCRSGAGQAIRVLNERVSVHVKRLRDIRVHVGGWTSPGARDG